MSPILEKTKNKHTHKTAGRDGIARKFGSSCPSAAGRTSPARSTPQPGDATEGLQVGGRSRESAKRAGDPTGSRGAAGREGARGSGP